MPINHQCSFCGKIFPSDDQVRNHIRATAYCRNAQARYESRPLNVEPLPDLRPGIRPLPPLPRHQNVIIEDVPEEDDDTDMDSTYDPPPTPPPDLPELTCEDFANGSYYRDRHPDNTAGQTLLRHRQKTSFQALRDLHHQMGVNCYSPFPTKDEWELGAWAIRELNHRQIDGLLKFPSVKNRPNASFHNTYSLLQLIDKLRPSGPGWTYLTDTIEGDLDEDGVMMKEEIELWKRNPVDIIRELAGRADLDGKFATKPEGAYADRDHQEFIVADSHLARWWSEKQTLLSLTHSNVTIMPVAISTDETKLTLFRGDKAAYPVYMTVLNIAKDLRRQPSSHTTVLLGYLPSTKLHCFNTPQARSFHGHRIFHECMKKILEPLIEAGRDGIEVVCPDGYTRRVWPILAAYIADYPEQCKVTCAKSLRCPKCTCPRQRMGDPVHSAWRDHQVTLVAQEMDRMGDSTVLDDHEMKPVYNPFWEHLPHCNIFECITPDIMHELHKSFYDHLLKWNQKIIGKAELDWGFTHIIPPFYNLHSFKKGVSKVSQWTMTEHKQMEKVFLGILAARSANSDVTRASRAFLEFVYLAQLHRHTRTTIGLLKQSWRDFHAYKHIFIELGGRDQDHFNIPKIHKMMHYPDAFVRIGSGDGTNTEATEQLHINLAKEAYRASNKKDFFSQMTRWLIRHEAVDWYETYIRWSLQRDGLILPPVGDAAEIESDDESELSFDDEDEGVIAAQVQLNSIEGGRYRDKPHQFVAKKPAHPKVTVETLVHKYGATHFILALTEFLEEHRLTNVVPDRAKDLFGVYNQVHLLRPPNPYIKDDRLDLVKTVPEIPKQGRRAEQPARFDVALLSTADWTESSWALEGLQAARVRVIFDLPKQFGQYPDQLVYIEWFTKFGPKHAGSGMYQIQKSVRGGELRSEIVPLSRLIRAAHLTPVGIRIRDGWSPSAVLDQASSFVLNWWASVETWAALALPAMGAIAENADEGPGVDEAG